MRSDASESLRRYYDGLSRRLLFRRRIGAGEGAEHLTMHRALADAATPEAPPSPLALETLLEAAIDWPDGDFAGLDLGCGYGGAILRFAQRRGGRWLGLTLSSVQAARAQSEARRRRLATRARFLVRSYDAPFAPEERFDVAIAVESLIHSPDKAATLGNVAAALAPGGVLTIIDDVAVEPTPTAPDLAEAMAQFRAGWMAPDTPDEAGWRAALDAAGLEATRVEDLTPLTRPRPNEELDRIGARLAARRRRAFGRGRRALIDGEIGGLALERLYNAGAMRYLMLSARKV